MQKYSVIQVLRDNKGIIFAAVPVLTGMAISISISAVQVGLGLMLIALIFHLFCSRINIFKDCPYFTPFFIYWLATLPSLIFGSEYAGIEGNLFAPWQLLIFFCSYYFVSEKSIKFIFPLFILSAAALSVSVIYQNIITPYIRMGGFHHYMMSAHLLSVSAALSIAIIISGYEKRRYFIAFYSLSTLIILAGIIATDTRMPLLALSIAVIIMLTLKLKMKGLLISALITVILIALILNEPVMRSRWLELGKDVSDYTTSHGWRLLLWKNTWELFKEYPIFGIGGGAFDKLMMQLMPADITWLPRKHAHNGYLMQLVTYGAAGFAAFCFMYYKIIADTVKSININKFAFIGATISIVYLTEAVTEDNFGLSMTSMQYMFLAGIMLGAMRKNIEETSKE